ncbi:MAG: hypothetical protein AAFR66_02810 [Bacteroidota bacterium]
MKKSLFTLALGILIQLSALHAQETYSASFVPEEWKVEAEKFEFTTYKGKAALYLENGVALHKEASLQDGVIEFDISFEEARRFMGIQFRKTDPINYEEFYVRPHQSGNPDATQYTPVFNGNAAWQLYHGEGHSAAYSYNFGEWIHVKLLISGNQMDIFLNDMSQPFLYVHELKQERAEGAISFSSFLGGGYFANLTYTPMELPGISSKEKTFSPEEGIITSWEVSPAFSSESMKGITSLKDIPNFKALTWETAETEYTGMLNLSRFAEVSPKSNTILVRAEIASDEETVKRIELGYSDQLSAFVNGQLVYSGQNNFRSRDYRYLGTIGFFDAVYVPLKKGKNTVYFAVSENFGGWGIKGRLSELEQPGLSRAE